MSRDQQQQRDTNAERQTGADVDVDAEHKPEVSRRASNAGLRRQVQMKGGSASADAEQVQQAAQRGTAGPGGALPHAETIQKAFGSHDISDVRAHVGGNAQAAAGAMGAEAYATGNQIAFGKQPDLHTAAHEAAHVVQQKKGVSLSGGVGQEGDSHEKHADAIADQVVAGKSVEHMLGAPSGGATAAPGQAVQKKEAPVVDAKSHEKAELTSNFGAQSALKHLAVQLDQWRKPLTELAGSQPAEGSGYEIAAQKIDAIFASAEAQIDACHDAIITVKTGADRSVLAQDVRAVQWAWNRFNMAPAPLAAKFLEKAQHHAPDLKGMEATVKGMTQQIGYEEAELPLTETKVDGDEKSLAKQMMSDQVSGLSAAVESVKAGNEGDVMRINFHARYLDNVAKDEPAQIKSHHGELKKLFTALEHIRKDEPALDLAEAHNHLIKLIK